MFRKYKPRKTANPLIVVFRLILSLIMFAVLLAGGYSAYKHFSGLDPLKIDPQALISNLIKAKTPAQFLTMLSSVSNKVHKGVLGDKTIVSSQSAGVDTSSPMFSFLMIADSHSDSIYLQKAINQAKQLHPDLAFIIGLGDYTNVGTVQELKDTKKELDLAGLRYFLVPGDHDLWDSRNRSLSVAADFKEVFGPDYQSFTYDNFTFLLIDNSDDYKGIDQDQSKWITTQLEKAGQDQTKGVLVFLHEPLYHPISDHSMGKLEKQVKQQAKNLTFQLKEGGVKEVFAGDTHDFSQYNDPQTNLPMVSVGAITRDRNLQLPRFAIGYVFGDGSVRVEDVEIK